LKIKDIIKLLESTYPLESALSFDNSGANIVDSEEKVRGVLVCLDVTKNAIKYAIENNVNLIISHHPIIFDAIKSINDDVLSKRIKLLIKHDISVYSMHTNFDSNIKHGMGNAVISELFTKKFLIKNLPFDVYTVSKKRYGIGNYIEFAKPLSIESICDLIIKKLNVSRSKLSCYDLSNNKNIKTAIIMPGSGSSNVVDVIKIKPDLYVTSDLKHNNIIDLVDAGISYINATHYGIEKVFVGYMYKFLLKQFKINVYKYYEKCL